MRDNDAFRNLGRWDKSNRVSCGRCRARRALVEGYDTRARPFTRSQGRLRAPIQKKTIGVRSTGGYELYGSSWLGQPRSRDSVFENLDYRARTALHMNDSRN